MMTTLLPSDMLALLQDIDTGWANGDGAWMPDYAQRVKALPHDWVWVYERDEDGERFYRLTKYGQAYLIALAAGLDAIEKGAWTI